MAYYSQDRKKSVAPKVRTLLKEYGLKGSLSVDNYSTVVLTIREGKLDFIRNYNEMVETPNSMNSNPIHTDGYMNVNVYWYKDHFSGKVKEFFTKILRVLNEGNHNNSDAMTDYFHVGWYVDVNVGRWDKNYKLVR